jgi:hypothetical protein
MKFECLSDGAVIFRIHIDHMDNPKGDIWAVSWNEGDCRRHRTANFVQCRRPTITVFRGPKGRQPRAFLEGLGEIWRSLDGLVVQIR